MAVVRNVVFDLGGVLLNWDPVTYLKGLFQGTGQVALLHKVVFGSAEWVMLDRGVITECQAIERLVNQHPSLKEAIELVFSRWMEILVPIPSTVEVLKKLKQKGYPLYVISNFHEEAFAKVFAANAWFQLFDGLIISSEIKVLKPEPAIYQALLDRFSLQPQECVFIDDLLVNVEGARQMGLKGIHYQNAAQFATKLGAMLGWELA